MFTLTEAAGDRLTKKLENKGGTQDTAMRFVRKPRGWKLRFDQPASGDIRFAHRGRTVLVLDAGASELLDGRVLDTKGSGTGSKLCLR